MLVSLITVVPARATNFAVLLQEGSNKGTCDGLNWFSQSGAYAISSITFAIPNTVLQTPKELRLEYPSRSLGVSMLPSDLFSFDVSLYDPMTDSFVTQFDPPVIITSQMQWTPNQADPLCLSYYDESSLKWVCQDECLEESDQTLCGTTDHFSTFALAPLSMLPEPASLSLVVLASTVLIRRSRHV